MNVEGLKFEAVTAFRRIDVAANQFLVRAFALIGRKRFEFVILRDASQFEVYDFPRSWNGVSRFVGYMPAATSSKLLRLATEWAKAKGKASR